MESITEAVLHYQDTGEGYEKVVERISLIVYHYPDRIASITEEDKCDFYLSFYNRIDGMIRKFDYQGYPFETLLKNSLKWHSRSFLSRKNDRKRLIAAELSEEEFKIRDLLTAEPHAGKTDEIKINFKGKTSKKRLLYLVLMDSPHLSDGEIETFCLLTGHETAKVLKMKDKICHIIHDRSHRLNELREKRNAAFMKLRYKQIKLRDETEEEKRKFLEAQIDRLRKRLCDTRYEISRVSVRPTHSEIAELLQIPKGTVDSGIHYFRKKVEEAEFQTGTGLFL